MFFLKNTFLIAPFFLLISACSGGDDKGSPASTTNGVGKEISGRSWCLDNSKSFYLDNDTTQSKPVTEIYTFSNTGDFTMKMVYKINPSEVVESAAGKWTANGNSLTMSAAGETHTIKAEVQDLKLTFDYGDGDSDVYFSCDL